ncbi:MAG TPA: ECF-type sigma factor [Chthoniobacterales bacterium]|nr:ECF-type sigma factor [Chthoniobacterales bacterium]
MAAVAVLTRELIDDLTATVSAADADTLRGMLPAVYDELRRVAAGFMQSERPDHTLQPTALVHEAYLRMANQRQSAWQNRAQLLGIFARMMRRILIDHANARWAEKRGGKDAVRIALDENIDIPAVKELNLLEVDESLQRLERLDDEQAKIVEMRFFGGLTIEEIAAALAISPTTVKREWAVAKRWLQRDLARAK